MKILIVDDSEADRMVIQRQLSFGSSEKHEILAAESAEEAMILMEENLYDCVLLDYVLPGMDGISLLKRVYDPELNIAKSPVVVLTGQGSEGVVLDALRYGAQDYLMKGILARETLLIAIQKARYLHNLIVSHNDAKKALFHSEKMKAIGQLAGGVAHDFNNLLAIIQGNVDLLHRMIEDDRPKEEYTKRLNAIGRASKQGADLVSQIMSFSRQRQLAPITLDLTESIENMRDLLWQSLEPNIVLDVQSQASLWPVKVDPSQIEHAILNICINARDAMPSGGKLSISTQNVHMPEWGDHIRLHTSQKIQDNYVLISIADEGIGMSEEVRRRVFEPFFTTKDVNKGTGLGLSTVYGFVEDSNGFITVESEEGNGTTFNIFLPAEMPATSVVEAL